MRSKKTNEGLRPLGLPEHKSLVKTAVQVDLDSLRIEQDLMSEALLGFALISRRDDLEIKSDSEILIKTFRTHSGLVHLETQDSTIFVTFSAYDHEFSPLLSNSCLNSLAIFLIVIFVWLL